MRALRANGHVVGFMGDGINDAPALRAADIGISVDSAVDIAKEAADIILLEKSLMVLEEGVIEGRKTFSNMLKYIRMTASSNFGNVFSVLVASAFIPFLPMLPLHLLVQNLLYDVSQIAIPFDNVDEELIKAPIRWNPQDIGRFMVFFGPISSVFDFITFYALLNWFGAGERLFQTGWFIESMATQILVVFCFRTRRWALSSRPNGFLVTISLSAVAVAVGLTLLPIGTWFGFVTPSVMIFAYVVPLTIAYLGLVEVAKALFYRYEARRG